MKINRRRKESIGLESEDTSELIKSFAKNLPKNSELFRLLEQTLKLEEHKARKRKDRRRINQKIEKKKNLFSPNVFRLCLNSKKRKTV